ncbi:MAG: helix-hairpin-helix domain-containing protein [bacterium]|nr:helix-hairpin-helix domain-containing protein [bacterium]
MANANAQLDGQRLAMLTRSAVNHALALLQSTDAAAHLDNPHYSAWVMVANSAGRIEGQYRFVVEDEAGKLHLNSAFLTTPSRGTGWSVGEQDLAHALGLSPPLAARLLEYRYGQNHVPGARGDDDANNILLMSDGIDNNANGVVDEDDEGVDDPGEYSPTYPCGDDRRLTSIAEVLSLLLGDTQRLPLRVQRAIQHEIPRRATVYAVDLPGSATLPDEEPADLNAVSVRQARRLLGRAQARTAFTATQRELAQLAVNLVDYRDQNHVLSTLASTYGVEAVSFNEVLANDGTEGRYTSSGFYPHYGVGYFAQPTDRDFSVSTASLFWEFDGNRELSEHDMKTFTFNKAYDAWNYLNEGCWDVMIRAGGRELLLLGPAKNMDNHGVISEAWLVLGHANFPGERWRRFQHYVKMRADLAEYGPRFQLGDPGFMQGPQRYQTFDWPPDFFKNCYVSVGFTRPFIRHADSHAKVLATPTSVKILASSRDGVLRLATAIQPTSVPSNVSRAVIWGWRTTAATETLTPGLLTRFTFQGLQPRTYYLPVINAWSSARDFKPRLGFAPFPQVLHDDREPVGDSRKWTYGGEGDESVCVRTSRGGCVDIYLRSGSNLRSSGSAMNNGNYLMGITFVRPEVLELFNVSSRPISLRGWTLTFNTGSIANDIGTIEYSIGYGSGGRTRFTNPVIGSNGYFYLVNNEKLFTAEFGSRRPGPWGTTASQRIPIWPIPNDAWGVQYRVRKILTSSKVQDLEWNNKIRFYLENERFTRDNQFKGEVFEVQKNTPGGAQESPIHGSRYIVHASGRDWIEFRGERIGWFHALFTPPAAGGSGIDTLMLLGMPAKGGVVSMTLKNEYKQISARTVTYAYRELEPQKWYGQSAEKVDPTQYEWVVREIPTIGGTPRAAQSHAARGTQTLAPIKNGPYVSVGELQRVRSTRPFANLGAGSRESARDHATLAALASSFCTSALRLEATDPRAERAGWQSTVYTVAGVAPGTLTAADAAWEVDQWKGQSVRFLSGRLRGEIFPISGNGRTTLHVGDTQGGASPRSTPNGSLFTPAPGDVISVGPGYATGLCYARRPEQQGEWIWRRRIPIPGRYHLYVFGLNDSISTTEFLEENDNAALDVELWNYRTSSYDLICRNQRYGKDDGFYAGVMHPDHVSPEGDIRLRLTARDVQPRGVPRDTPHAVQAQRRRQSGFAWFNYALITPVPVFGRVNVNTATQPLLRALPGITPALAHNIWRGIDTSGRATLKPYAALGDLLRVRGMTPEVFERFANLACVNSRTFTIAVHARLLKDSSAISHDSVAHTPVLAEQRTRVVVRMPPSGESSGIPEILDHLPQ